MAKKELTLRDRFLEIKNRYDRKTWLKMFIGTAFVLIAILGCIIYRNVTNSTSAADEGFTMPWSGSYTFRHPLTGGPIDEEMKTFPQVFGVMIENSTDAWPLSGLEDAFLVFEAPVEGGIPRFLAFFEEGQDVAKIGPVRSARPYYIDWADEFDAVYAHVGGSPEALDKLRADAIAADLNEFFQGEYFWRDNLRYAPHNVYTSSQLLRSALSELKLADPSYGAWTFGDPAAEGSRGNVSVGIDWRSASSYDVLWQYNDLMNNYVRYQGGNEMKVADGDGVSTSNVVVIETDMEVVDTVGRRHMTTIGEGNAAVFQNGKQIEATWKKTSPSERLRLYDKTTGSEIVFVPGSTWIEVVESLGQIIMKTQSDEPIWD